MKLLFLLLIGLAAAGSAAAQSKAILAFQKADQIVLVSHEDYGGLVDKQGREIPAPPLVVHNKPNYPVFLKSSVLLANERATLIRMLARPFKDRQIVSAQCCEPHHTIFLVNKSHTSYIDICFGCRCVDMSPDLYTLDDFDNRKWKEVKTFFDKLGLAYPNR